jgi:hypothetical protein
MRKPALIVLLSRCQAKLSECAAAGMVRQGRTGKLPFGQQAHAVLLMGLRMNQRGRTTGAILIDEFHAVTPRRWHCRTEGGQMEGWLRRSAGIENTWTLRTALLHMSQVPRLRRAT